MSFGVAEKVFEPRHVLRREQRKRAKSMALRYIPQRAAISAAQLSIESSSQGSAWCGMLRVALLQLSLRAARRSHTAAAEGRVVDRAERERGGGCVGCKLVPTYSYLLRRRQLGWRRGGGVGDGLGWSSIYEAGMLGGRPSCQLSTRLFQSFSEVFVANFATEQLRHHGRNPRKSEMGVT